MIFIIKITKYNTYYNMNKKLIRLTEGDLHRIVKESVNRVLKEMNVRTLTPDGAYGTRAQKYYGARPGDEDLPPEYASALKKSDERRRHNFNDDEVDPAFRVADPRADAEIEGGENFRGHREKLRGLQNQSKGFRGRRLP